MLGFCGCTDTVGSCLVKLGSSQWRGHFTPLVVEGIKVRQERVGWARTSRFRAEAPSSGSVMRRAQNIFRPVGCHTSCLVCPSELESHLEKRCHCRVDSAAF